MELHYATLFESLADAVGDATALVQGADRRRWARFDERAARLAAALAAAGVRRGGRVAEYLHNGPEYLEAFVAALKQRLVPVNVNYRYLGEELLYLLVDSEAEVLVCHASLYDQVAAVRHRAPALRQVLVVDDDPEAFSSVPDDERYEHVLAAHEPAARISRSEHDPVMIYTGGTTGPPKGVVTPIGPQLAGYLSWVPPFLGLSPQEDVAAVTPLVAERVRAGNQASCLVACPLMHGTGLNLGALPFLCFGGRVVLLSGRRFDPAEVWSVVERERIDYVTLVGDAFARPLLTELREGRRRGQRRDLSSLVGIVSSGAMFSAEVKAGLLELVDQAAVVDFLAASEGAAGYAVTYAGGPFETGRFMPVEGVKVLTEDGREVTPGSGEEGLVAISGPIPDGYFHDEAKTASTFRVIDGVRWSFPGDWATVDEDGQLRLLGRGSQCINTGGEKVYPEEVEEVVKLHPDIEDCLVFGVPDERFGQRVVAVASVAEGSTADPDAVLGEARGRLSGYKLPRSLVIVPDVPRAPNGKPDYPGARELFLRERGGEGPDRGPGGPPAS